MAAAETPFKDYWASTIHPAIKDDFVRLLRTTPKRIAEKERAKAEKISSVLQEVQRRANAGMRI